MQTFRREKRISKKPKHAVETKKSLKRENFLSQILTHTRLTKVIQRILATEFKSGKRRRSSKGKLSRSPQAISDAQTLAATGQAMENLGFKGFPRIESAGQMQLFEVEKEGPKPGQVTRAVSADIPQVQRKDIFYVHYETKTEEELKHTIDYNDLLVLKSKAEGQAKSCVSKEQCPPLEDTKQNKSSNKTSSAFTVVLPKSEEVTEPKLEFDFREYGKMIMRSICDRYKMDYNTLNSQVQY